MVYYRRATSIWHRSRKQNIRRMAQHVGTTTWILALSLCGVSVRPCYALPVVMTSATTVSQYSIWLYQNGVAVLTPDAYIMGGGVYTDTGFIGTIDPVTYQIYDDQQQLLGFVASSN